MRVHGERIAPDGSRTPIEETREVGDFGFIDLVAMGGRGGAGGHGGRGCGGFRNRARGVCRRDRGELRAPFFEGGLIPARVARSRRIDTRI